jgi:putative hemolysin
MKKQNKKILMLVLFLVFMAILAGAVIVIVVTLNTANKAQNYETITNFEQCSQAGYPILESYPAQCKLPNGKTFVQKVADPLDMANPASQYCKNNGGKVEIRDSADGQYGVCVLNTGKECEEWAFFRGACE